MAIEVFKTNVRRRSQSRILAGSLQTHFSGSVHFDLEDCDKVLRIEAPEVDPALVIRLVKEQGFDCEVLD